MAWLKFSMDISNYTIDINNQENFNKFFIYQNKRFAIVLKLSVKIKY